MDFCQSRSDHCQGLILEDLVIQGHADADVSGKLTQDLVSKTVDFCFNAFVEVSPEASKAVMEKLDSVKADPNVESKEDLEKLTDDELAILRTIRARQMMRSEDAMNIDTFKADAIEGFLPRLETGKLGLSKLTGQARGSAPVHKENLFDKGLSGHADLPDSMKSDVQAQA